MRNNCKECGGVFDPSALNKWKTCQDCVDTAWALADLRTAIFEKRDGLTTTEKQQEVIDTHNNAKKAVLPIE